MGITWRSAMPLLSTLAALVIIVHSAEENLVREHRDRRYDLRPRLLDTRPSDNDQPWRVVRAEPVPQQAESETWNNESQEEPPVRRRLGRKRKRRPPAPSGDDDPREESHEAKIQNTETEGRRKKIRQNRWTETSLDTERPIRRRGQRRKRPSLSNWPQLSEFGSYQRDNKPLEKDQDTKTRIDTDDEDDGDIRQDYFPKVLEDDYEEKEIVTKIKRPVADDDLDKEIKTKIRRPVSDYIGNEMRAKIRQPMSDGVLQKELKIRRPVLNSRYVINQENENKNHKPLSNEDKSLSEFSVEVMGPLESPMMDDEFIGIDDKLREKSPRVFLDMDKAKEKSLFLELDKYFDFKSDYVQFIFTPGERNKKTNAYTLRELIEEVKSQDKLDDSVDYRKRLLGTNQKQLELTKKIRDKLGLESYINNSSKIFEKGEHTREQDPIDPMTLKDILKKSNGTSLSEILQQHNLTLADLLNGKENAIAVLKSEKELHNTNKTLSTDGINTTNDEISMEINENDNVNIKISESTKNDVKEYTTIDSDQNADNNNNKINKTTTNKDDVRLLEQAGKENYASISINNNKENISSVVVNKDQKPVVLENRNSGMMVKRRFPTTVRRKLRMRPMLNNTFKSQINRDLIALSARRYVHHNKRNATKSKEWREMIPLMINTNTNTTQNQNDQKENILTTTTSIPEETTISDLDEGFETTIVNNVATRNNASENEAEGLSTEVTEPTTITIEILATEMDVSVTERPTLSRPISNAPGLRRQALNNRLKKKRLKQRTSTTEAPQDDIMKNLLELGDLVSSSEFIARTQLPKATSPNDHTETVTELEDFLTTDSTSKFTNIKSTRYPLTTEYVKSSIVTQGPLILSTEETAKIEIEEILNDTRSSAKLSKILKERNMTLNELLEHRERGSSQVHLADIFHNASREPNPPEPFLSKSLIEPISKETYPLRAILEANSHEQAAKATTVDPIYTNHVNIPVIMDFGNNVNENAENMGIMSLFNNFTSVTKLPDRENSTLQKDSNGTPYKSTIIAVNTTDDGDMNRESRMLNDEQDMISWNEIFSMIRRNQKNETKALEKLTNELPPQATFKKIILEEDVDGDGLIVLEDLQHLRDTNKEVASGSEEKIEFNSYEGTETPVEPGILSKAPSSAKSVTVATASIVGLAMILFLLTYAALKWKQQRIVGHKKTFVNERIPTPVFENRKVKKNCSSRSISPMLPTSNIYTMNTLDSQTGKDSPEYMWDTLRKPFQ